MNKTDLDIKLDNCLSSLSDIIHLLKLNDMPKWANKYQEVLIEFKNENYSTAFDIINNSWVNCLGWSHRGYPESQQDEELLILSSQVADIINDYRVNI